MKALDGLREQVVQSVSDWHTAMDKFDAQHSAQIKVRVDAEGAIKAELEEQLGGLRTKTDENYEAQLVLLEGVRDELHAKVDQTAEGINSTILLHKKESDRSIDRAITSAESRADSIESSLERDIASVRGELSGVEEELTKLEDDSRQTLLGFREYISSELESASASREEIREEFKAAIDTTYQDGKNDLEFATKTLEDQMRNEITDEISTAKDELQDEIKETAKELSAEIANCKEEIDELGKLQGDMQGLRVRVTANALSITSIDSRSKAQNEQMATAMAEQKEDLDSTLHEVSRLVADTNETMLATTSKLVTFEETLGAQQTHLSTIEEQLAETVTNQSFAEQTLRIQSSKLEERLNKRVSLANFEELSGRVEQLSATMSATATQDAQQRSEESTRLDAAMSERKAEVDKRLSTFGQLLKLNSEKDEASEAEMNDKICAVLSPELADLFRKKLAPDEL